MMDRRQFIGTTAGTALSLAFPLTKIEPRRTVDLAAFCGESLRRFDTSRPFEQTDWTYATDTKVCLRVRPQTGDLLNCDGLKLPPAFGLPWDHDSLTGWRPWKLRALKSAKGECFRCNRVGWVGNVHTCRECTGDGCPRCYNSGSIGDRLCPRCEAYPDHEEPWHAFVGDHKIDVRYFRKLLHLGDIEFADGPLFMPPGIHKQQKLQPAIRFRFAEGVGLLMPLAATVPA